MNKINYLGSDVVNLKRTAGSRADYAMRNTLDYVAGLLEHDYHTPDDMTFEFRMNATLNNGSSPNIVVLCSFTPRGVIFQKSKPVLGQKKPTLVLEMHYKTDVEMTEKLYCDIMKLLSHLGRSALYNNSSEQIYAMRGEVEKDKPKINPLMFQGFKGNQGSQYISGRWFKPL